MFPHAVTLRCSGSTVARREFIIGRVHGLTKEEVAIMDVIIKCLAILQVNVLYVQLMQGQVEKNTESNNESKRRQPLRAK